MNYKDLTAIKNHIRSIAASANEARASISKADSKLLYEYILRLEQVSNTARRSYDAKHVPERLMDVAEAIEDLDLLLMSKG